MEGKLHFQQQGGVSNKCIDNMKSGHNTKVLLFVTDRQTLQTTARKKYNIFCITLYENKILIIPNLCVCPPLSPESSRDNALIDFPDM